MSKRNPFEVEELYYRFSKIEPYHAPQMISSDIFLENITSDSGFNKQFVTYGCFNDIKQDVFGWQYWIGGSILVYFFEDGTVFLRDNMYTKSFPSMEEAEADILRRLLLLLENIT